MKVYAFLLVFAFILISGCTMDEAVVCNPPYMRLGIECCLDQNNNTICDVDEGLITPEENITELSCVTEGNTIPVIAEPPECCAGLELIPPKETQIVGISGYCTANCGDGVCNSATESELNCPEDCEEEYCVPEGGALPVIPDPPVCCNGLSVIDVKDPGIVGVTGYCSNRCGDGLCNTSIESNYNCPIDCTVEVQAEPEPEPEPCGDGICDLATEDSSSCCSDCGCDPGEYCSEGSCIVSPSFTPIGTIQVQLFSFCGDNICSSSENSSAECCADCGCTSGSYCSNNTCVAGTPPLFMPMYIVATAYFPSAETLISDGESSSVKPPRIYGNKIVFAEITGPAHYQPYMYDTNTGLLQEIPYPEKVNNPDISYGKIVWSDYGVPGEGDEIYLYDYSGGTQGYINPRPTYQYSPKVWNNAIIWEEQMEDSSDYSGRALYFFWIPSAEERKFFHNSDKNPTGHEIWGGDVVFTTYDWDHGDLYELWNYDISTDDTVRLFYSDDGKDVHSPSIWDEKVVYINGNDEYAHVYVYDLNSKITQKITSVNSKKRFTAIYEDKVVWSDNRNGNYDIYMYDLVSGEETQITSDDDDDWKPDIYFDKIVWIRGSYSGSPRNVYMYTLS
jgi:beta propeller repeat protein